MNNLEAEYFDKVEDLLGELESMERLTGVLLTSFFEFRVENLTLDEIRESYSSGQVIINGLFDLLNYRVEQTKKFIEEYPKK